MLRCCYQVFQVGVSCMCHDSLAQDNTFVRDYQLISSYFGFIKGMTISTNQLVLFTCWHGSIVLRFFINHWMDARLFFQWILLMSFCAIAARYVRMEGWRDLEVAGQFQRNNLQNKDHRRDTVGLAPMPKSVIALVWGT